MLVLLDVSAAFDTIDDHILLYSNISLALKELHKDSLNPIY